MLSSLDTLYYIYPCTLFCALWGVQGIQYYYERKQRLQSISAAIKPIQATKEPKRIYSWLLRILQSILSLLFLSSITIAVYEAATNRGKHGLSRLFSSTYLGSHIAVFLFFLAGLLPDLEGPWNPTAAHCSVWITSVTIETAIAFMTSSFGIRGSFLYVMIGICVARIAILVLMISVFFGRWLSTRPVKATADEQQSLLGNGSHTSTDYVNGNSSSTNKVPEKKHQVSGMGWFDYFAGFRVLFPYLWPKGSPVSQGIVVVCLILLAGQRIVNALAPIQLGSLVDSLGEGQIPYKEITLYVVYRALQGNQGAIGAARAVLWIPVSQSLFRRMSCAAFEHVLGLSLEFHLNKKVGEVTSALSRGSAINSFLESFCFQLVPMIFDIFVAGVVFFVKFDPFYTIIVFFIMWSYIFLTIYVAKFRAKQRRDMTIKAREMEAIKTDALIAYETVQHNCAAPRETGRFQAHVFVYQMAERAVQLSLNGLNFTQSSIFTLGTALIVAISAYKISIGEQSVGDFVTLINYFVQLQGPLNFFGTYYTMVQNNFIEAERILDLFEEMPGVVERPNALSVPSVRGEVSFNDVKFSYHGQGGDTVLSGINFTVPAGTKTAIVGESGAGKSTCLKLLFRFYDVSEGAITVDGHDIRDLTLDSLRQNIGVVPQDPVLFNETIMYNLLYAKPSATEEDVYEACKTANIHDAILAFPDGYQSKVGERGLKLSGGERQRIAIARAILKDTRILLLDEATSSLDSHTEKQIQGALDHVTAGRTTVTIAHRLSTITTSDQIVVLHNGKVAESGTHASLLALQGRYYSLWVKQTTIEEEKKVESGN